MTLSVSIVAETENLETASQQHLLDALEGLDGLAVSLCGAAAAAMSRTARN
jgi:hypothetical protein